MLRHFLESSVLMARAHYFGEQALVSRVNRRVRLEYVDAFLHMNQAMYPLVMEQGRADWLMRSGAWPRWREAGYKPVVAEQRIVYRRELKPLQRFVVDSRAVGMDGRLLVLEHHLLVGDAVHAKNTAKLIFTGAKGVPSPDRAAELCDGLFAEPLAVQDWKVV